MIESTVSSVGGVVDIGRIESLPLNGRQFANLAATIPGVGLGMHSDPTKSTQFSPQINGGNGRNVNYQIDGGDNNDDTVGGLLQLFPLEAIQEFNFVTSRAKAENGRSNGGVMNIVTKSGTNDLHGSFFEMFRDTAMNSRTTTEKNNEHRQAGLPPQPVRRQLRRSDRQGQAALLRRRRAHAAGHLSRPSIRRACSRPKTASIATPYRETLLNMQNARRTSAPTQYLSVRYGRNQNSQPYGASASSTRRQTAGARARTRSTRSTSTTTSSSAAKLNEFIFQYADFRTTSAPTATTPGRCSRTACRCGQSPNTPQTTEQKKWQFRDDFSWHVSGMGGVGHDFKAGVNFINEPRLYITFNGQGRAAAHAPRRHGERDRLGRHHDRRQRRGEYPARALRLLHPGRLARGRPADAERGPALRPHHRLPVRSVAEPELRRVPERRQGRAARRDFKGMENFGNDPKDDTNNWQPRVGFAWDIDGSNRDVVRGGFGVYMDMAYTNSNALFAGQRRVGPGFGTVLFVDNPEGIRNPNGTFYHAWASRCRTSRARTGRPSLASRCSASCTAAAADAVHAADHHRLVASAHSPSTLLPRTSSEPMGAT